MGRFEVGKIGKVRSRERSEIGGRKSERQKSEVGKTEVRKQKSEVRDRENGNKRSEVGSQKVGRNEWGVKDRVQIVSNNSTINLLSYNSV